MAIPLPKMDDAYRLKISLLEELLSCIKRERDNLVTVNLENLWAIMEEKQGILTAIEKTRDEIKVLREKASSARDTSAADQSVRSRLLQKIADLKGEIRARVQENISFIQESLDFFDEMMSIFVTGEKSERLYHPLIRKHAESSALIYYKEV
jgi:flagellar biosynthesis/type III secretory pathway chaperone